MFPAITGKCERIAGPGVSGAGGSHHRDVTEEKLTENMAVLFRYPRWALMTCVDHPGLSGLEFFGAVPNNGSTGTSRKLPPLMKTIPASRSSS